MRLRQAGVTLSPSRYRATVAGSIAGDVPRRLRADRHAGARRWFPPLVVGFAPRAYYRRRQRKALAARMAAWPEAIRDVLSHITVGSTLHGALVAARPFRPGAVAAGVAPLRRQRLGARRCPPRSTRPATSCADPVSDRVIEAFAAAHERGQSVVVDVLRTLADDVTKDLQLTEQIITGQTEVRAQAVVAALLPFFVLLPAGVDQRRVPRLLPHRPPGSW